MKKINEALTYIIENKGFSFHSVAILFCVDVRILINAYERKRVAR